MACSIFHSECPAKLLTEAIVVSRASSRRGCVPGRWAAWVRMGEEQLADTEPLNPISANCLGGVYQRRLRIITYACLPAKWCNHWLADRQQRRCADLRFRIKILRKGCRKRGASQRERVTRSTRHALSWGRAAISVAAMCSAKAPFYVWDTIAGRLQLVQRKRAVA